MNLQFTYDYINGLISTKLNAKVVRRDFISNSSVILEAAGLPWGLRGAVVTSLFERMNNSRLKYHTPVHILRMLQTIDYEKLTLPLEDYLAIIFHDVVYDPMAPSMQNEIASSFFCRSALAGYSKVLDVAARILQTGKHCERDCPDEFRMVMDIDMFRFGMPWEDFTYTGVWLKEEFVPFIGEEKFYAGTAAFLTHLIAKGFIFRSGHFKEKYEKQAMENAKAQIILASKFSDTLMLLNAKFP